MKLYRSSTIAKFEKQIADLERDVRVVMQHRDHLRTLLEQRDREVTALQRETRTLKSDNDSLRAENVAAFDALVEMHQLLMGDGSEETETPERVM